MNEFVISSVQLAPLAKGLLRELGCSVRITAHGSSMRPFLRDGDILTIIASDGSDIRIGDVAFHERPDGSVVAHRVLAKFTKNGKIFLKTRGDAIGGAADVAEAKDILGKAVSARRGHRSMRLDGGAGRIAALLWVACSPVGQLLLQLASRLGISQRAPRSSV